MDIGKWSQCHSIRAQHLCLGGCLLRWSCEFSPAPRWNCLCKLHETTFPVFSMAAISLRPFVAIAILNTNAGHKHARCVHTDCLQRCKHSSVIYMRRRTMAP